MAHYDAIHWYTRDMMNWLVITVIFIEAVSYITEIVKVFVWKLLKKIYAFRFKIYVP